MQELIRRREELARLEAGSTPARPIEVPSFVVMAERVRAIPCPQCEGEFSIGEERSESAGLRAVEVWCRGCNVPRTLWLRVAEAVLH